MTGPETLVERPPRLGGLYASAALGAVGPRGHELPDTVLVRPDARIDRDHLARYARVCGLPVADALPVTYPHVLAFPLQVALMARRSFPLPLPGLVHVANRITVHRSVDAAERLAVRVHAEGLRAHPKGAQVDLVARVDSAGETVWEGRSTYLARGAHPPAVGTGRAAPSDEPPATPAESGSPDATPAGPPDATPPDPPAEIPAGPPAATWRVDAATGRRYAHVSGDVNPIHLYPWTAKVFGFPRAIAHGMWIAARAVAALQGRLPAAVHYDVTFGRPLLLPSTVELRTCRLDRGWAAEVRSTRSVHLTATLTAPATAAPTAS